MAKDTEKADDKDVETEEVPPDAETKSEDEPIDETAPWHLEPEKFIDAEKAGEIFDKHLVEGKSGLSSE